MERLLSKYFNNFSNENISHLFSDSEKRFFFNSLSRDEEKRNLHRDEWDNFEYHFCENESSHPYIDNFVTDRLKISGIKRKPNWNGKKFALFITHDVDVISMSSSPYFRRSRLLLNEKGLIFKAKSLSCFLKGINNLNKKEILDSYDIWQNEINNYGYKSTFFVFNRPNKLKDIHKYDCDFKLNDYVHLTNGKKYFFDYLKDLVKDGFEIGIHGSYKSALNSTLLKQQKEGLENLVKTEIISGRQHYLRFDINVTPKVQLEAGLKIDSTLGFNRNIGFRSGTSFPYLIENDLFEFSLNVMDGALFTNNALDLNEELASIKLMKIIDEVEKVGGALVINFHPNNYIYPYYFNTFKFILSECKKRDAFNSTLQAYYNNFLT